MGLHDLANIFNDNLGAKRLTDNPMFHSRSKHIDLRHHFVRDAIRVGYFRIEHVSTENMIADVLTKGLPGPKHTKCFRAIELAFLAATNELECVSRRSVRE